MMHDMESSDWASRERLKARIVMRAVKDPGFRDLLLRSPVEALRTERGVNLPRGPGCTPSRSVRSSRISCCRQLDLTPRSLLPSA